MNKVSTNVVDFDAVAQDICDDMGWAEYDLSPLLAAMITAYSIAEKLEDASSISKTPAYYILEGFTKTVTNITGEHLSTSSFRVELHKALER